MQSEGKNIVATWNRGMYNSVARGKTDQRNREGNMNVVTFRKNEVILR